MYPNWGLLISLNAFLYTECCHFSQPGKRNRLLEGTQNYLQNSHGKVCLSALTLGLLEKDSRLDWKTWSKLLATSCSSQTKTQRQESELQESREAQREGSLDRGIEPRPWHTHYLSKLQTPRAKKKVTGTNLSSGRCWGGEEKRKPALEEGRMRSNCLLFLLWVMLYNTEAPNPLSPSFYFVLS